MNSTHIETVPQTRQGERVALSDKFWLNVYEAAAYSSLSEATIRTLLRAEGFPSRRIGGRWAIHREQFERWLEEQAALEKEGKRG